MKIMERVIEYLDTAINPSCKRTFMKLDRVIAQRFILGNLKQQRR